jgi:hypothetical protein
MSIADIMDFAGDYSGKKKLQNQRELAAHGDGAENLYDDSDRFFRRGSVDQPLGFDRRSSVKPSPEPLISPFSAPFIDSDDSPAPMAVLEAATQSAQAQNVDNDVEPAPLIGVGGGESIPALPAPVPGPQPAPRKRGFFGRIGAGLQRMWSGFRSLFGGGRGRPSDAPAPEPAATSAQQNGGGRWAYAAPPEPRPDAWFLNDRPQVEQELVAQAMQKQQEALAPKPEEVEKQDWDNPDGGYAKWGLPMSRPASRNPALRDRTADKYRVRLDKDRQGNKNFDPWYKQSVVDQITNSKPGRALTDSDASRMYKDSVAANSPMMTDIASSYGYLGTNQGNVNSRKRALFMAPPEATDSESAAQHGMEHLPGRYGQLNLVNEQFFSKLGRDLPKNFREDGAEGNPLFDVAHRPVVPESVNQIDETSELGSKGRLGWSRGSTNVDGGIGIDRWPQRLRSRTR